MEPTSTFIKRFGDLVALLRVDPGNDAAQDLALAGAATAVAATAITVQTRVATDELAQTLSLRSRLLARNVERVRVAAGAEPGELLALARALSHDVTPLPSTTSVALDLAVGAAAAPADRRAAERRSGAERRRAHRTRWPGAERRLGDDRRSLGERRHDLVRHVREEILRLQGELNRAAGERDWAALLGTGVKLVRLAPRVPLTDRRTFGVRVRRAIPREAMHGLIALAEREPGLRASVAEVLHWLGLDAAEAILEHLSTPGAPESRPFLIDVLAGMADVYPLILPLLHEASPPEVCLGATLMGRLGRTDGVDQLRPHLRHPDEQVRTTVVRALGELHPAPVADALREALRHPSPGTRAAAADAIAEWRDGALGLLLVSALQGERDPDAWRAHADALARIGSAPCCAALAGVALTRRTLLRRRGYPLHQRLAAVHALERAGTPAARTALDRVARQADRAIRPAARRAVSAH